MGVIDVNIPESITIDPTTAHDPTLLPSKYPDHPSIYSNTPLPYASKTNDLARLEGEKLATYLWQNYIEPFSFNSIIVIGAGHAFHSIARVITSSSSSSSSSSSTPPISDSIPLIISFVSEQPVRALSNPNNPWLGTWYRDHSRVYVAHDHSVWTREKKSRKYGSCVRAPAELRGLNDMMVYYREEVWGLVGEVIGGDEDDDEGEEGEEGEGRVKAEDEGSGDVVVGGMGMVR